MHHWQQRVKLGKLRGVLVWTGLGLAGCGLVGSGLAGCSTHPPGAKDQPYDPLIGPPAPNVVQPTTATANQSGGLPPIPPSSGVNTNASLASQTPTGQALAITGSGDGWARKVDGQAAPATQTPATPVAQPKVELIPKDTSVPAVAAPIQPTAWTAGSQPAPVAPAVVPPAAPTTEQIDKQLADHGVTAHNTEVVPGGIRLTCVVRNATNPTTSNSYYTTARDYATAAQAIIHEIEAQQAHP